MGNVLKSKVIAGVVFAGAVAVMATTTVRADHLVEHHELQCSETFPCADELRRRVDFWINVFRKWESDDVILHDSARPERVYQVLHAPDGCSGKKSSGAKARNKIKKKLLALAGRIDKGNKTWTDKDLHLVSMFPSRKAAHLRSAAKRIRCQQGNRDRFVKALQRFGKYKKLVAPILKDEGLPDDILYLPFVESAYNPHAYSRVGAAGLWQIMPRTGRGLGLKLNATIDERLDPEAATRAAARYLNDSKKRLTAAAREKDSTITAGELNPFIITSYNYGVAGMRRAINKLGPDFVLVLNKYKSASFQTAVKNFYASFLAARHVAKNETEYFGKLIRNRPLRYDSVQLKTATSLKRIRKVFGVDDEQLKALNPALTRYVWHEWRFIPKGYVLRLPDREDNWKPQRARFASLAPESESSVNRNYRVKKGDTACGIAHAFRIGCRDLIAANSLGRRGLIRVGQKLLIPGKRGKGEAVVASSRVAADTSSRKAKNYKVRKGDTPCGIARTFGVNCKALMRANGIGKRGVIKIGQKIKVPGTAAPTVPDFVKVKKGDTACGIARRLGVDCGDLLRANGLNRKSTIRIGQKLYRPGREPELTNVTTADSAENSPAPPTKPSDVVVVSGETPGDKFGAPLDSDIDLRARYEKFRGKLAWVITVEPDETLGHFADWLDSGFAKEVRRVNRMKSGQSIRAGQTIRLPIKTDAQKAQFEQRRSEYHRVLAEEFKEHFVVVDARDYTVKAGDSPWAIASRNEMPVWVLMRFNPDLRRRSPSVGDKLSLPVIKPNTDSADGAKAGLGPLEKATPKPEQ